MEIKNVKFIYGGKIADNAVDITIENGKISKVSKTREKSAPRYVTLPYVDIHTHGAVTHDVTELSENALSEIGNYLLSNGIGAYLPTFVATPLSVLDKAFEKLRNCRRRARKFWARISKVRTSALRKKARSPLKT